MTRNIVANAFRFSVLKKEKKKNLDIFKTPIKWQNIKK